MITIRCLLLFSSLALLAGCASAPPCGPGLGHGTAEYCHYRVKILEKDLNNYLVKGEILDEFFEKDKGEKYKGEWVRKEGKSSLSTFRVWDLEHLDKQMLVGTTYNFSGPHDSTYLELYPEEIYDPTVTVKKEGMMK